MNSEDRRTSRGVQPHALSERDRAVVWHPYTQAALEPYALPVRAAEGAILHTEDGRAIIDAVSSWWVTLHGHSNRQIAAAISEQACQLEQVIFAGFTHRPAVELAEQLLEILPSGLSKIFYSDDGSTAVEVALKMALQFWSNRGEKRRGIVALQGAYHGDTFGAMSVSGGGFASQFSDLLFSITRIPVPLAGREQEALDQLEEQLRNNDTAALIVEPLVLGAGGMVMYSPEALEQMIAACRRHNVLVIADEVMTGFGRTGRMFASDYTPLAPDIVCLSKGLTGGFMPLGVTAATEAIFDAFCSDDRAKMLLHGHSFTANPLACAAARTSLELLQSLKTSGDIARIIRRHTEFIPSIAGHRIVRGLRQLGTILAFDLDTGMQGSYFSPIRDKVYRYCLDHGVLLRPLGNVVYVLPPYCISDQELSRIYETILGMLAMLDSDSKHL